MYDITKGTVAYTRAGTKYTCEWVTHHVNSGCVAIKWLGLEREIYYDSKLMFLKTGRPLSTTDHPLDIVAIDEELANLSNVASFVLKKRKG